MKKLTTLGGAFAVIALALPNLKAASVVTNVVNASATITANGTLTTQAKNVAGDADAPQILFQAPINPDVALWSNKGAQYVAIKVDNAVLAWELKTYTKNFTPADFATPAALAITTTTWGFQYGGLKGNVKGAKVPMSWISTTTLVATGLPTSDPVVPGNPWLFLKDFNDQHDPLGGAVLNPACGCFTDTYVGSGGYPNVAFGNAGGTTIVTPALKPLALRTSTFFYYVGANFRGAAAASYTTNINFELVNL